MLRDHDFHPADPEEEARRQEEEAFARRVRREVRRISSGEADEQMRQEVEEEEAERQAEEEAREREERRHRNIFVQLFNGTILLREGVSRYYRYLSIIAAMFLLSIMMMFRSLYLDMTYSRLEHEVQVLHERSLRLEEERYRITSHSAVVEELEKRGIELEDPKTAGQTIK